jgi:predicted amidohydrolase YtcJ
LLIRNGFVRGVGIGDLRIEGEEIAGIAPRLRRRQTEEVIDAAGGEVLPGLHDHHVHLLASAAAGSVPTGPPDVRTSGEFDAVLSAADRAAPSGAWIRGIGYHQSVAGDLDAARIDAVVPGRPVRVQHRSGALWVLNSPALAAIGPVRDVPPGMELDGSGRPTGRLWRLDGWLGGRLPRDAPDLGAVSRAASARGVTGFTDATPYSDPASLGLIADAGSKGTVEQRLQLMTAPGVAPPRVEGISVGPVKVLLDDVSLPALDALAATVSEAHRQGRPTAFHCVTRAQAVLACAAIGQAGPDGDRIEHGAVMDLALAATARDLGLTVVTQPAFVRTRGDRYLRDVEDEDLPDLWRLGSLISAGVAVAGGTDGPFGPSDPWVAIRAATDRATESGQRLGPGEAVSADAACGLFAGQAAIPGLRRQLRAGAPADICILADRMPSAAPFPPVLATVIRGRVVYRAGCG